MKCYLWVIEDIKKGNSRSIYGFMVHNLPQQYDKKNCKFYSKATECKPVGSENR